MITVTEKASTVIKEVAAKEKVPEGSALRIGITTDGCEGSGTPFRYQMGFDDRPALKDDQVFESHGVKIFVDAQSLPRLEGLVLDVQHDPVGGFKFLFKNPNASHSCGCGKTFSPEPKDPKE